MSRTLSSRLSSLSRSLVGSSSAVAVPSTTTTAAWIAPPTTATRHLTTTTTTTTPTTSTSSKPHPTLPSTNPVSTSTSKNTRCQFSTDASAPSPQLASRRGQAAVDLLPSYLKDARHVTRYCPETAPNGALQLGVAESQLLTDLLVPALQTPLPLLAEDAIYYQPTQGRPPTRAAVASYMESLLQLPAHSLDVEGLVLGAGCNAVLENLCTTLTEPGDAVLIPTPYYAAFEFDLVARAGLTCQPVYTERHAPDGATHNNDEDGVVDPARYYPTVAALDEAWATAQAAGNPPRILLLSHPHNPLGICYPPDVLQTCLEWCLAHEIHLIADEIYAGSVYNTHTTTKDSDATANDSTAVPFTSMLQLAAGTSDDGNGLGLGPYVHWVYALSKDFALSGLRVGVAYSENPYIRTPLQKLNDLCQISSQTQIWVETLLTQPAAVETNQVWPEYVRDENHVRLRARCQALLTCLDECQIPYVPPTAGLFCWMDLSAYLPSGTTASERERALYLELMNDFGLLFTPGDSMHNEQPGFFRMVFTAASEDEFALGLQRLRHFCQTKQKQQSKE